MTPPVIEVIIAPTGATTVQTKGYSGSQCLLASQFLEQTLGVAVSERKTADFYQTADAQQHVQH